MASYDIAILGSGIVGVSAAVEAVGAGARVVVIDPAFEGKATLAGAGIVSPIGLGGSEARLEWSELVASSIGCYHRLLEMLADAGTGDVGFRKVGEIVLATREDDVSLLEELLPRLQQFKQSGVPIGELHRVDGRELQASWPEMRSDMPGLYIENISRLDGRRMSGALAAVARLRGVDFRSGVGTLQRTGRTYGLQVDGEAVAAETIIVAAGAWSQPLLDLLGTSIKVHPVRGQIVHLRTLQGETGARPVINTFEGHYFLGFEDGRVVAGGTHEPEAGFDCSVTAGGVHSVLSKSLRVAPGLAAAAHIETRVGLRPKSSDGYPIIGRPASAHNVVVATGLGAWGLTLGPLIGEVAAQQALGRPQRYDTGFLRPDRAPIAETASLSLNVK